MTVRRSRRASPPTLLGTFSRVVVLFAVARLALVQCSVPSELHPAQAPSGPGRASVAAPRSEASARQSAPARGTAAAIEGSVHVALGVPNDGDPSDEYWLNEDSFVLSYDPSKRVPNWVAWRLERDDLGHARRR